MSLASRLIRLGGMLCSVFAASGASASLEPESLTHPVISADGHWVGAVWVAIAGVFLAAAVIGPIVRADMPTRDATFPGEEEASE